MVRKIVFLLVESSIEPIDNSYRIPSKIKKLTRGILDSSFHYRWLKDVPKKEKRGRPDIVHRALLTLLDSPLNKLIRNREMGINILYYIHTINGEIIYINSETRIPRHYIRFLGLFSKLFETGVIKNNKNKVLLKLMKISIRDLLDNIINGEKSIVVGYDVKGERVHLPKFFKSLIEKFDVIINIVGAFPRGEMEESITKLFDYTIAVSDYNLSTTAVLCKIISCYEQAVING